MSKLADRTFGLDSMTLTLLAILETREPTFAKFHEGIRDFEVSIKTHLYYEGHLTSCALSLYYGFLAKGQCRVIVFSGDPKSSNIVVRDMGFINDLNGRPPTPNLFPDHEPYDDQHFRPQDVGKAVDNITRLLKDGYEKLQPLNDRKTVMQAVLDD